MPAAADDAVAGAGLEAHVPRTIDLGADDVERAGSQSASSRSSGVRVSSSGFESTALILPPPFDQRVAPQMKPAPKAASSTLSPGAGGRRSDAWSSASGRSRRRCFQVRDAVDDAVAREAEPLTDGRQDARVGLVVDEQVDVVDVVARRVASASHVAWVMLATACLKVSWPCMRIRAGSRSTDDQLAPGAAVRAERDGPDPARRVAPAERASTAAPAPSANSGAVWRRAGSVIRDIVSAPISRTWSARPDSIWRPQSRVRTESPCTPRRRRTRGRIARPQRVGHKRRGVREDLIGGSGRDQHEIEFLGVDLGELGAPGGRRPRPARTGAGRGLRQAGNECPCAW